MSSLNPPSESVAAPAQESLSDEMAARVAALANSATSGFDPRRDVPDASRLNKPLAADSNLFPLDAPWLTMHHDKGQLGRCVLPWMERLFQARLEAGETPIQLAVQCWIMTISGMNHGLAAFDLLVQMAPEAAQAMMESEAARSECGRLAVEFNEAAARWEPPSDMAVRGWGKMRSDSAIETGSRVKFAHIAACCAGAAALGLPAVLSLAARSNSSWLSTVKDPGQPPARPAGVMPQYLNAHGALGLMIRARKTRASLGPGGDAAAIAEILELSCQGLSPKNFRSTLKQMCPDPWDRARMGAAAGSASVFKARHELDEFDIELAAFRREQAQRAAAKAAAEPVDESYSDDEADEEWDGESYRHLDKDFHAEAYRANLEMAARTRDFELRHERARDTLAHLGNWALNEEAANPGLARFFFESALDRSLGHPQAGDRADAILLAARGGRLKLSVFALGLAQTARDAGFALKPTAEATEAVWRSHLQAFSKLQKTSIPKHFPQRHLALASLFPHAAFEDESIQLAPGPMLALIEEGALSLLLTRHVPDLTEPGMESEEDAPAPAPARKLRL